MVAQAEMIDALKEKVSRVVAEATKREQENVRLQQLLQELSDTVQAKDREMIALKSQFEQLKLAKAIVASSGNVQDARQMVGKIVREIDKCIALLNR